ncbi:MAG: hypothetical protein CSYNP_02809 [Syntrophus sp. SKADARSKE-3]|nr:hypothetical protein [Syntrophus sp. SKADARSKE-3]
MGNNSAFTAFETTVIATYNKGILDKELLSSFMEQYRGTDIDKGGASWTVSNDGLNVVEIVIKTFGGVIPQYPDLPKDHLTWTPEQYALNGAYEEEISDKFRKITDLFEWW